MINQTLILIGAVMGPLGLVISLAIYFRDRAKMVVSLSFDRQGFAGVEEQILRGEYQGRLCEQPTEGGMVPEDSDKYFVVRIENMGRRPICLGLGNIVVPRWPQNLKEFSILMIAVDQQDYFPLGRDYRM
jgi:hypothetical protein